MLLMLVSQRIKFHCLIFAENFAVCSIFPILSRVVECKSYYNQLNYLCVLIWQNHPTRLNIVLAILHFINYESAVSRNTKYKFKLWGTINEREEVKQVTPHTSKREIQSRQCHTQSQQQTFKKNQQRHDTNIQVG